MDPLDQALNMEFLEKWVCMVLKFLTNSEAEQFFLLGWINTGMNLIIKGLFKWLDNQMMIEFGSLEFLSHLNIDQKNQILKVFFKKMFLHAWIHFLALGCGIDLFGDSICDHKHTKCADALQVIRHFRLNSLQLIINKKPSIHRYQKFLLFRSGVLWRGKDAKQCNKSQGQ